MVDQDEATLHPSTPSTAASCVTVFTLIRVPVLRSVDPKRVAAFLQRKKKDSKKTNSTMQPQFIPVLLLAYSTGSIVDEMCLSLLILHG